MASKRENSYIIIGRLVTGFFHNLAESLYMFGHMLLGKSPNQLSKGKFLKTLHFVVYQGPKSFWKRPTGIRLGRSIGTLIHVVFFSHEKKK